MTAERVVVGPVWSRFLGFTWDTSRQSLADILATAAELSQAVAEYLGEAAR